MSSTRNATWRRPGVLAGAAPAPSWPEGVWNLVSSSRPWPSGVCTTAMSARTPSSPTTRSTQLPSTGSSPSSSSPSSTKNPVAAARSSTTTPTWSNHWIMASPPSRGRSWPLVSLGRSQRRVLDVAGPADFQNPGNRPASRSDPPGLGTERARGLVPANRSRGRHRDVARPVLGDPPVDPFPPAVQPLDLRLMVGRPRYLIRRHPPPAGPDDLIDRELPPHIADRDDVVEPGVRHEDHVGVGAGRDGGDRPARTRREQVGHIPGPFGQIRAPHVLQPPDPAPPPARGPVPALGEDDQRAALVQPPGQPRDLLGEDVLAGLARLDPHVR